MFLTIVSYFAFNAWEYFTGGKYIEYLTKYSETIPLETEFQFTALGEDVEKNKLILVGEIHGFEEPAHFDVSFFKYLNKNHNVNHYIAELDFVQAQVMNEFLENGDEELLDRILSKWVVQQGRKNKDYYNKYIELHQYYASLPENQKFEFIGIDKIQDSQLTKEYLNHFSNNPKTADRLEEAKFSDILNALQNQYSQNKDTIALLAHINENIQYNIEKLSRDEIMFRNFKSIYNAENLSSERLYGFLGIGHAFLYQVDNMHPFASLVRTSSLGLQDDILTINMIMNNSKMVIPSNQLPSFMQSEGPFTKIPVSADNMFIAYIIGIKDFNRMTPKHHKSLIKMNASDSPYGNSVRMNYTIQLLPIIDLPEITEKGKPYFQYTLFIRNSDWAEPMHDNN